MLPILLALALVPAQARTPRNVVLLIADDLGREVGCYGDAQARTPNLDALAKKGTRFTHAFATVASCSPSRASLYTGQFTHSNGQYGLQHAAHNFVTRPNVLTLPAILNKAGYRTGIIGKVHVGPAALYPFEVMASNGRNGVAMAKQASGFIASCAEGGKPFCLVMGYTDPHRAVKGFANEKPWPGIKAEKFDPKALPVPDHLPDNDAVRADLAEYYQAANRLDQGVGALLDVLKKTGRDRDTLVLFLSDNGIPFPGAKTTVYDAGIRLPLIAYRPGQKAGVVSDAMVSFVDVLPTMLDWCGVKAPPRVTGRSFLGILEEERPKGWDEVYASHSFHEVTMYYPMRAVRTRQYKYIRNLAHPLEFPFASDLYGSPSWQSVLKDRLPMMGKVRVATFLRRPLEELYDVTKDPAETRNLAGDPAHAKTLEALRAKVKAWQEKTGDPWTIKYEHE